MNKLAVLRNKQTGEERKFNDSITATKRLWNMPFNHRRKWEMVDKEMEFEIDGENTSEIVEFLNPINYKECLRDWEALMLFTKTEYEEAGLPITEVEITWTFETPFVTEKKYLFMDRYDVEQYCKNITNGGDDGYWKIL